MLGDTTTRRKGNTMKLGFIGDGMRTLGEAEQIALASVGSVAEAEEVLRRMGWTQVDVRDVPDARFWDFGEGIWTAVSWWWNARNDAYGALLAEGHEVLALPHDRESGFILDTLWPRLGYATTEAEALALAEDAGYELVDDGGDQVHWLARAWDDPNPPMLGVRVYVNDD